MDEFERGEMAERVTGPENESSPLNLDRVRNPDAHEIARVLQDRIRPLLLPDDVVINAVEATWLEGAQQKGPGTYQGALVGTNRHVFFIHNPEPHSQFADVHDVFKFTHSEIVMCAKMPIYLTMANGYRMKAFGNASHRLVLKISNSGDLSFVIPKHRFKDMIKFIRKG